MTIKKSNRGVNIDLDALVKSADVQKRALGNMGVNARGDKLGQGGEIVQQSDERVREYHKNNPKRTTTGASLKTRPARPDPEPDLNQDVPPKPEMPANEPVKEGQVPKKTRKKKVVEPDEFAPEQEPLGYKEVELPNGDIEMVPYYRESDK
jgi:hypothetical protein